MPVDPIKKEVKDHFYACEACGYEGGFHVTFKKKAGKTNTFLIVLMCPQCNQTYDIDWQIRTQ